MDNRPLDEVAQRIAGMAVAFAALGVLINRLGSLLKCAGRWANKKNSGCPQK